MPKNNTFFYISGFISLSFFALFAFLFLYMMFSPSKTNTFALKKDNYISISLEAPKPKKESSKKSSSPIPAVSEVEKIEENIDVNDLFSDVWTKKIAPTKPKEINSKRIREILNKIATSKNNAPKTSSKINNDTQNDRANEDSNTASTASEVNEYLAKIQALVYKYFNVPPNSEGNSVKALIHLNSLGKVIDFRVLTYSNNEALNLEVDKIKGRLLNVVFPINKENQSTQTIVILTSKE